MADYMRFYRGSDFNVRIKHVVLSSISGLFFNVKSFCDPFIHINSGGRHYVINF